MRALLDINVLIALLDEQHVHHQLAAHWLHRNIEQEWASCPLTQNGVIRIMSQPAYPNPLPAGSIAARLAEATSTSWHQFYPDDISLLDGESVHWDSILGSRQVTDCYLLALAVRHDCRFVSFDRRVDRRAVPGSGSRHLVIIGATGKN